MKIKDIKDKENLIIKIEVNSDGSETIYRMLDRYNRSWPDGPWQDTFNMIFGTNLDYHDSHHKAEIPYEIFIKKCPYSERTILNYKVELDGNIATLVLED